MTINRLIICLLYTLSATTASRHNTNCDVGPNALTEQFSVDIPQSCITVAGQERCYYTYIPECASESTPVVYDIHGYGECPRTFSAYSGWFDKATEECFVVVWPTGNTEKQVADSPCWSMPGGLKLGQDDDDETVSCCCHQDGEPLEVSAEDGGDDVEFLHQMAFFLARDVPILTEGRVEVDTLRIYMSGHANGCLLAHAMAAYHSDLVAAVACMAGMSITAIPQSYDPVPTWTIAGALDEIMPPGGARTQDNHMLFPGHQLGFEYLSEAHACTNVYNNSTSVPDMDLPDYPLQGTLHVQTSFGCLDGAVVQHHTLVTAGHLLYKGTSEIYPEYGADTTVDTTGIAWNFMTSFKSRREPILEQVIDLSEIRDLLEEEEPLPDGTPEAPLEPPQVDEEPLQKYNENKEASEPATAQEGVQADSVDDEPLQEGEASKPNTPPKEEEEEDSSSSPWRGLRGPGISIQQAMSL